MPQLTEPANIPPAPYDQSGSVFVNSTIRQTIHTSIGGDKIRIRISNAFGTTDLPITAVTVALPVSGLAGVSAIQRNTLHTVTFSGSPNYTIPDGALVVSDPVYLPVAPVSMLTVTIYLHDGQTTNFITSHPGSRTTSWMAFGNQVSAAKITDSNRIGVQHWYFLNALGRIDRDVLSHSSVQYAMIFEGVNDIGTGNTDAASQKVVGDILIAAFKQIVTRLQFGGITVFAATITPFSALGWNKTIESYSNPERENTRQRVNKFIRESGIFDAVIDFDEMLRNETHPEQLQDALQGGDYLHLNSAGYKKMADEFPLDIF